MLKPDISYYSIANNFILVDFDKIPLEDYPKIDLQKRIMYECTKIVKRKFYILGELNSIPKNSQTILGVVECI